MAGAMVGVMTSLLRRLLRVGRAVAGTITTLLLVRSVAPVIRCIAIGVEAVAFAAARGGAVVYRIKQDWGSGGGCRTAVA